MRMMSHLPASMKKTGVQHFLQGSPDERRQARRRLAHDGPVRRAAPGLPLHRGPGVSQLTRIIIIVVIMRRQCQRQCRRQRRRQCRRRCHRQPRQGLRHAQLLGTVCSIVYVLRGVPGLDDGVRLHYARWYVSLRAYVCMICIPIPNVDIIQVEKRVFSFVLVL